MEKKEMIWDNGELRELTEEECIEFEEETIQKFLMRKLCLMMNQ